MGWSGRSVICSLLVSLLCVLPAMFNGTTSGQSYQGCFQDGNRRKFPHAQMDSSSMTNEMCISHCKTKCFLYAATQSSVQCFCGTQDNFDNLGSQRPETECSSPCPGDTNSKCGGSWRNSVFSTEDTFQYVCEAPPPRPEHTVDHRCKCLSQSGNSLCVQTYMHECTTGFRGVSGDANRTCSSQGDWTGSALVCEDVDECATDNEECDQICNNTEGSYSCLCRQGYELTGNGRDCEDVDECGMDNGLCDHQCDNTLGSYTCSCNHGHYLDADGHNCTDIQPWSAWGSWSNCSLGCGLGRQGRSRECPNQPDSSGNNHCPGHSTHSQLCFEVQLCTGPMDFQYVDGLLNPTDDPNGTHTGLEARRLQTAESFLPEYDRSTFLTEAEGGGFDIAVSAYLRHVGQLSDKHANMSVTIEYVFSWFNTTLSGLTDGWVPAPDSLVSPPPLAFGTTVRQAAAVDGEASSRWLNEEGLVVYKMTRKFKVSCSVSLKNYPFDTQTCVVQLRGYGGARLRLLPLDDVTLAAIKTDATEVVSQFELTGVEIQGAFHSFMSNTKDCIFFKKTCDYDIDRCLFGHHVDCDASEECRQCRRTVGTCRSELDDCRHYHSDIRSQSSRHLVRRMPGSHHADDVGDRTGPFYLLPAPEEGIRTNSMSD